MQLLVREMPGWQQQDQQIREERGTVLGPE